MDDYQDCPQCHCQAFRQDEEGCMCCEECGFVESSVSLQYGTATTSAFYGVNVSEDGHVAGEVTGKKGYSYCIYMDSEKAAILGKLERIANAVNLPEDIRAQARSLVDEVLKGMPEWEPPRVPRHALPAVLLFLACRGNSKAYTLLDFAQYEHTWTQEDLGRYYKRVVKGLQQTRGQGKNPLCGSYQLGNLLVRGALALPPMAASKKARVVQAASDLATWLDMSNTLNFSPLVTAAVSISMAADSLKVQLDLQKLADELAVGKQTVENRSMRVRAEMLEIVKGSPLGAHINAGNLALHVEAVVKFATLKAKIAAGKSAAAAVPAVGSGAATTANATDCKREQATAARWVDNAVGPAPQFPLAPATREEAAVDNVPASAAAPTSATSGLGRQHIGVFPVPGKTAVAAARGTAAHAVPTPAETSSRGWSGGLGAGQREAELGAAAPPAAGLNPAGPSTVLKAEPESRLHGVHVRAGVWESGRDGSDESPGANEIDPSILVVKASVPETNSEGFQIKASNQEDVRRSLNVVMSPGGDVTGVKRFSDGDFGQGQNGDAEPAESEQSADSFVGEGLAQEVSEYQGSQHAIGGAGKILRSKRQRLHKLA